MKKKERLSQKHKITAFPEFNIYTAEPHFYSRIY